MRVSGHVVLWRGQGEHAVQPLRRGLQVLGAQVGVAVGQQQTIREMERELTERQMRAMQ